MAGFQKVEEKTKEASSTPLTYWIVGGAHGAVAQGNEERVNFASIHRNRNHVLRRDWCWIWRFCPTTTESAIFVQAVGFVSKPTQLHFLT